MIASKKCLLGLPALLFRNNLFNNGSILNCFLGDCYVVCMYTYV
jgi:hypothetical protein